jgi:Ca2+-binding EF-hand superfamily protein
LVRSFKFFDISNTGEVDFNTFQKAIAKMGVVVDAGELENFFRIYDTNGSGTLDYKEFSDIIFGKA